MELNTKQLKNMQPGKIFATGTGTYTELNEKEIKWIAKRGDGFHDWAIYYHFPDKTELTIARMGDKCFTESIIKRLVPCDDEAFKLYRY